MSKPAHSPMPRAASLPEKGEASLLVSLSGSVVTVRHGTDDAVLIPPFTVQAGYWDALFSILENPERVRACNSHAALLSFAERVASWSGNPDAMSASVRAELIRQAGELVFSATA